MKAKRLKFPRVPPIRKSGGAHRDRTKEPHRKRKHKKFVDVGV